MGQILRSIKEGKVLVAKYLFEAEPWFSVGAERWRLFDASLVLNHREICGGILCELSLHRDGKCIKNFRYFRRDWFAAVIDPAYDHLDFSLANLPVDFVPHDTASLEKQ